MAFGKFNHATVFLAALLLSAVPARADDVLKVAIGQMDTWVNQAAVLGQQVGIFKKHGIVLENFATQGSGETLQAVISNAAQVGIGVGTIGVLRAYSKGAPVRIVGASFTGVGDLYWYVRSDSPISKLGDATERNTIAFSSNGSSVHNVVLAFVQNLGLKAKPTQTGGLPATLTQVMSGQVDIGWATPPFALKEAEEGKIRIIANGNDVASLSGQTVRVEIVNESTWKNRDLMTRFMRAYRESLGLDLRQPARSQALFREGRRGREPRTSEHRQVPAQGRQAARHDRRRRRHHGRRREIQIPRQAAESGAVVGAHPNSAGRIMSGRACVPARGVCIRRSAYN